MNAHYIKWSNGCAKGVDRVFGTDYYNYLASRSPPLEIHQNEGQETGTDDGRNAVHQKYVE